MEACFRFRAVWLGEGSQLEHITQRKQRQRQTRMFKMMVVFVTVWLALFTSTVASSEGRRSRQHTEKRAASLFTPSGWTSLGCVVDSASARVLTGFTVTDNQKMTVSMCLSLCLQKGFAYGGVQYGEQCYCGAQANAVNKGVAASECSMPCKGDASQQCGASWRMNLYQTTATASPTYRLIGCVTDGPARALPAFSVVDTVSMTVAKCQALCTSKGFSLAGVQYGTECHCDNTIQNGLGVSAPAGDCSSMCSGDGSYVNCGGSWRLSLFSRAPLPSSTSSSSTATPPASTSVGAWKSVSCIADSSTRALNGATYTSGIMKMPECLAFCAGKNFALGGVENGNECWCANSVTTGQGAEQAASQCNVPCRGDASSASCGGSWRISLWSTLSGTALDQALNKPSTTPAPSAWNPVYCIADSSTRALNGATYSSATMKMPECLAFCSGKNFALGGVENGNECWCGNSLTAGQGAQQAAAKCSTPCKGDSSTLCGGSWVLSLWSTLSGDALQKALNAGVASTTLATPTPTPTPTTSTTPPPPAPTSPSSTTFTPVSPAIAGSGGSKYVWAHHIIGNTYPYNLNSWSQDIRLALAAGIDGFALNIGPDTWQPEKVALAYQAAAEAGNFKMFISFDMTAFSCYDGTWLNLFRNYINTYQNHAAQARFNGKAIVTTFSGSDCTFGQGSTNNGWSAVFGANKANIYYMPGYTSAPTGLNQYEFQAEKNWGSAWPTGSANIETSRDTYFMSQIGGRDYVGTVSPLFFTHFNYKNWVWRGDEWLMSQRWEQLLGMRDRMDMVEVVSWNDYGESTYIGPITGDMPSEARQWVNSDFPHEDILTLNAFYASAWKTGRYPEISQDKVWVMARPHPMWAGAGGLGAPDHREWAKDNFYAQVHLTSTATVVLSTNAGSQSFQGKPGINRFEYPLSVGSGMRVQVIRNGATTVNLAPAFTFNGSPAAYNFNYFIKSS